MKVYQTVIIPTCNHPELLLRCLKKLIPTDDSPYGWEVLVMDNSEEPFWPRNRQVINNVGDSRIRRIEMKPLVGLMAARHLGAEMAQGEILSFIDDDSFVGKSWFRGIQTTFERSDAAIVGGNNLPEYEAPPPAWLDYFWQDNEYGRVCGTLSLIDFGSLVTTIPAVWVFGCNYSIRKEIFWKVGGSNPDYLPPQKRQYQGDGETGLSVKVEAHRGKAVFHKDCGIRHYVPASRLTAEYFANRAYFSGLHNSFTQIRREHGLGPTAGVPPLPKKPSKIRCAWNLVKQATSGARRRTGKDEISRDAAVIKDLVKGRYAEGWNYLREEADKDPRLLEYILRRDYLASNAEIPGRD